MKTLLFSLLLTFNLVAKETPTIRVGSKSTTESRILAEIIAQTLETTGEAQIERKFSLGESVMLFDQLKRGKVDIYPDNSGRIGEMLISSVWERTPSGIRKNLARNDIMASGLLGFDKTISLAVRKNDPRFKNIKKISDLKNFSAFTAAFDDKFLRGQKGIFPLLREYGVKIKTKMKMKKSHLIKAIDSKKVDMIAIEGTDTNIAKFNLRVLEDDKNFLEKYLSFMLTRRDFATKFPASWEILNKVMVNKIKGPVMVAMNAQVDLQGLSPAKVAGNFLRLQGIDTKFSIFKQIYPKLKDHLALVLIPLVLSTIMGVFLAVMALRRKPFEKFAKFVTRVYKPIPFLVGLCILIPFLGTGKIPVYVALFIFGIFPILKLTFLGLSSANKELSFWGQASHQILAGIKNTAFINVGMATLASYIGAGGLGDFIISGLSGKDKNLILMGVIPAIILAALIHLLVELSDKYMTPKGLKR